MPGKKIYIYLLMVTLFISCRSVSKISNLNLAHLYSPELNILMPEYGLTHSGFDESVLVLSTNSSQMLYTREISNDYFTSHFLVHYRIFNSLDNNTLVDSTTVHLVDTLQSEEPYAIRREFSIPLATGQNYLLYIELKDLNRRSRHSHVMMVEKDHKYAADFFTLNDTSGLNINNPFYLNYPGLYTLTYFDSLDFELKITRLRMDSVIAPPPFAELSVSNKDTLVLKEENDQIVRVKNGIAFLDIRKPGLFRISDPQNDSKGFLLYFYHQGFPYITESAQMIAPLRYITTNDEYQQMYELGDGKLAVDRFWTKVGGNPDRARELVKRYYNRVEQANILFTSFKPGWQTDQGMIFIVFGPPQMVFKTERNETWHYQETLRSPVARFTFRKSDNAYTHNNYILVRNPAYRGIWSLAADNWRR